VRPAGGGATGSVALDDRGAVQVQGGRAGCPGLDGVTAEPSRHRFVGHVAAVGDAPQAGRTAGGVGESTWVSFDPDNRAYLRYRPGGNPASGIAASVRWQVPEICPSCGAPVDQSRASVAAHPACAMCHVALPCQPLAST
jgi:hypothetical protein